jgi:uncharacterized protein YbjT (DUF2867 family)
VKKILVAGATGQLGRRLLEELSARNYHTRALVRDKRSAVALSLSADELFEGDVTRPATLSGACDGVDVVLSAAGASLSLKRLKGQGSYTDVDYRGNRNLLEAARGAGVGRFVYVSVFNENLPAKLEYTRAHEDFVRELKQSGLAYTVMRPTGFFSAFAEILEMARQGVLPLIGESRARVNPIHESDLARRTVDALERREGEVAVGGPEVFSRREIVELAFSSLGTKGQVVSVPPSVFKLLLPAIRLYDRRLHALFQFFLAINETDMVAPAYGSRKLSDFFQELARTGRRGGAS